MNQATRHAILRLARITQPIKELKRKARKATSRSRLYTQEELDLADRIALEMHRYLIRSPKPRGPMTYTITSGANTIPSFQRHKK